MIADADDRRLAVRWGVAALENATKYVDAAALVLDAGLAPQAYALIVFAQEEAGKAMTLLGAMLSDTSEVELKDLRQGLRRHDQKLAPLIFQALDDLALGEKHQAIMWELVTDFVALAHEERLAAQYVDIVDGDDGERTIRRPTDRISAEQARSMLDNMGTRVRVLAAKLQPIVELERQSRAQQDDAEPG